MNLLITIDTEEDNAWAGGAPVTTENVLFIKRFQELCDSFGFKPTWLTTEPMLADARFAEVLGGAVEGGRAEIGAHLHPWNCPPFPGGRMPDQSEQFYATEIPVDEFHAKLARVVSLIREQFGAGPESYRAGRWGFDERQLPVLLDLGIRVDCSVTPHTSWRRLLGKRDGRGGPDFRGAPHRPYWLDDRDVRRPGGSQVLELPMTVLYASGPLASTRAVWPWADASYDAPVGRALRRIGWGAAHFRPRRGRGVDDLLAVWNAAEKLELPYAMLMLHSSELMPAGSPYNPTAESIEQLYRVLEGLFRAVRQRGATGATLREFAAPYFAGRAQALAGAA